uniref:(California timema) hypothetical protein n=1 Tax=Timema californicum TaxID=61474 RepID=A0A7R9J9Y6_TIMCA|nr:unnamed protein product [Timema californicum]
MTLLLAAAKLGTCSNLVGRTSGYLQLKLGLFPGHVDRTPVMGLQKIFCSTTIIVGLFISVDYGLCDEFRCRGYEREHKSEDAGKWSWQAHSVWTLTYIFGLALWSLHYTLLEGQIVSHARDLESLINDGGSCKPGITRSLASVTSCAHKGVQAYSPVACIPHSRPGVSPSKRHPIAVELYNIFLLLTLNNADGRATE